MLLNCPIIDKKFYFDDEKEYTRIMTMIGDLDLKRHKYAETFGELIPTKEELIRERDMLSKRVSFFKTKGVPDGELNLERKRYLEICSDIKHGVYVKTAEDVNSVASYYKAFDEYVDGDEYKVLMNEIQERLKLAEQRYSDK